MIFSSKFFNRNWRYVFLVLALLSVIVSGGCGGSSSGGRVSSSGSSGGSSSVDWVSMSGNWKPVSGDLIFYDNSGNTVVTYVLDPYSSTNFEVTVSGSGSSYDLNFSSGSLYFAHESGTGSGADGLVSYLSSSNGTFTVSGKKLVRELSYSSANATFSFEYVDDNHVVFVVDANGTEAEFNEGAVKSVRTIYVERVDSENANNNNTQSDE